MGLLVFTWSLDPLMIASPLDLNVGVAERVLAIDQGLLFREAPCAQVHHTSRHSSPPLGQAVKPSR